MMEERLILYRIRNEEDRRLLADMEELFGKNKTESRGLSGKEKTLSDCIARLIDFGGKYGFSGNLWHLFLTWILVNHENAFSTGCEKRGAFSGTLNEAAIHDLEIFRAWFDLPLEETAKAEEKRELFMILHFSSPATDLPDPRIRDAVERLSKSLANAPDADRMKDALVSFYQKTGVGLFGLHKSFRLDDRGGKDGSDSIRFRPVSGMSEARLTDLIGLEIQKKKLRANTEAFLEGRPANNCLLYGDAGTGKSTMVKALVNEYHDRGLRIIEIAKHQFRSLNDVLSAIRNRNYRFLLFMDDLSFEEFETEYKYLKAVIEGGLEKRPDNVLIYATSNRRHLVRERFSDRQENEDDKHRSDTVQEKLSLSGRFGETIFFGSPEKKEFNRIVKTLAERAKIRIPEEELLQAANAWELSHGGLSGRTAAQFIDHLLSIEE